MFRHVWTAPDAQALKLTVLCRKQSCRRLCARRSPLTQMKSAFSPNQNYARTTRALTPWGVPVPGSTGFGIRREWRRVGGPMLERHLQIQSHHPANRL